MSAKTRFKLRIPGGGALSQRHNSRSPVHRPAPHPQAAPPSGGNRTLRSSPPARDTRRPATPSPEPEQDGDSPPPTSRKRSIDRVLDSLEAIAYRGAKRPRVDDRKAPLYPYLHGARGSIRSVPYILFNNVDAIFMQGIHEAGLELEKDTEADAEAKEASLDAETRSRLESQRSMAFSGLRDAMPGLLELLTECVPHPPMYVAFCDMIKTVINEAKNDDTGSLKQDIIKFVLEDPDNEVAPIPYSDVGNKSKRGFSIDVFARCLISRKLYDSMDEDYDACVASVNDGTLKVDNTSLPMLLYDWSSMDDDDSEAGLFRHIALVRSWRRIMFGKSNALNTPKSVPAGSNAHIHNVLQASPASIAYVCCQVRFAMSSVHTWARMDRHFDMKKFYDEIMLLLELDEDDPDEWVLETLRWWNTRAFGNPRGLEADDEEELVELGEEAGEIMDARERRKRARAATRAAGSPEV